MISYASLKSRLGRAMSETAPRSELRLDGFDYEICSLQHVSRSFALTIPQLPLALRRAVTNAYLICRIIDTIEDEEKLSAADKTYFLREFLDVLDGKISARRFTREICPQLNGRTLPKEKELVENAFLIVSDNRTFSYRQQAAIRRCAGIMIEGMSGFQAARDIEGLKGLKDLTELENYCYHVAGVVGEMLTELFCDYSVQIAGERKRLLELCISFGKGLQMTNILKDLWDDHQKGVCWIPRSLFPAGNGSMPDLLSAQSPAALSQALNVISDRARYHLRRGLAYTLLIPRSETGIRKFCLWALGMAVFTLNNVRRNPQYKNGQDVKISRNMLRSIIWSANAAVRSNYCLEHLFNFADRRNANQIN